MDVKISIFTFLINYLLVVSGQLSDSLDLKIIELQKSGADTIIQFTPPEYHDPAYQKLDGAGEIQILATDYIFYKRPRELLGLKTLTTINNNHDGFPAIFSKPIKISEDEIFKFVHKNLNTMTGESIFPFVSKYTDSTSGKIYYDILRTSHSHNFKITIHTKSGSFSWVVFSPALEKKVIKNAPDNINYDYNSSTKLAELFKMLNTLSEKLDSRFIF